MKSASHKAVETVSICLCVLPLIACTQFEKADVAQLAAAKTAAISNHQVFNSTALDAPVDPCIIYDGDQVINTCPPPTATSPVPPVVQPVEAICSNDATQSMQGNVTTGKNVKALFVDSAGSVVCEVSDPAIQATLINERKLVINDLATKCPMLATGSYTLQLKSDSSKNLLTNEVPASAIVNAYLGYIENFTNAYTAAAYLNFYYGQTSPVAYTQPSTTDALARRPASAAMSVATAVATGTATAGSATAATASLVRPAVMMNGNPGGYSFTGETASCEFAASPLLVQLGQSSLSLSAPLSGISFDILGERNAHAKKRISWLSGNAAAGNYFIVLPNAQGGVNGIDELFGDNTAGPDHGFAANGYAALAKWDGRKADGSYDSSAKDGLINEKDAVFSRLRLWSDTNGDGIAQASELHPLKELGVVAIDLGFEASYKETDRYGNEIKMKSTVRTADGAQHVMYDIWFRLID